MMKRAIVSILAVAVASVCLAEEQKIKLTFSTDKAISQMTGTSSWASTEKGGITVFGREYRAEAKYQNGLCTLGIDTNRDGKISARETTRFSSRAFKPFTVSFKATIAGEERNLPVIVYDGWANSKGATISYRPAWAMSGKVGGQTVYFVNNPKDDKFSYSDTFYTAKSLYLIPFRPNIFVNGKFYKASIAEDGTEVTLEEVDQSGFGKFSFKSSSKGCQCLILSNGNWAFDLMDPTIKAVPEDTFEIRNCTYGTKGAMLTTSSEHKQEMTFKAGNENIITIGAPFIYYFKATLNGDSVQVEPTNDVMGCGGEIYCFDGTTSKVPPTVMIYTGRKCSSKGRMEFG